MNRWGDLASKAHAHIGPGMPELRATRFPITPPEREGDKNLSPAYASWTPHDYTYGLSKASLRPVVLDEKYDLADTGIVLSPKRLRTVNDPRVAKLVRRIQPVLYTEPGEPIEETYPVEDRPLFDDKRGVPMPDDTNPDNLPWWLDEEVLVSRNDDMIRELLEESQ